MRRHHYPPPDLTTLCQTLADLVEDTAEQALTAEARGGGCTAELAFMVRAFFTQLTNAQARLFAVEGQLAALRAGTGVPSHN